MRLFTDLSMMKDSGVVSGDVEPLSNLPLGFSALSEDS